MPIGRRGWMLAAALHAIAVILAVTVPWFNPRRVEYVVLQPLDPRDTLTIGPFGGTGPRASRGPLTTARAVPDTAPPAVPDSGAALVYDADARLVPAPAVGDGRLWVSPRPALPAAVAEAIYGDPRDRDAVVTERLRAMVDSLNVVIDSQQQTRRAPSWTVGGEGSGIPKFGLDSQFIHVAGIKIPTMVLALLGSVLPQGNFDEGMRNRQLQRMREDLLQAAARAETLTDFRRYVRELRTRKQEERDAERRRRAQDTTRAIP